MVRKTQVDPTTIVAVSPELAAQWHPTKNGDLTPDRIAAGSNKKVWWKCSEGPDHEWEAVVSSRLAGRGCGFCAGKSVSVTNSLASINPELATQWHPTKNGDLTPDQIVAGSGKKVWWKCPEGPDHEWQTTVVSRLAGKGCGFCANLRVSVTNSLASINPELATQWHPTKNGDLTPDQIVAGSGKKVWWKCPKGPDHEWFGAGGHCGFCAGKSVSVTNSLASINPELAAQWHPTKNGDLTPDQIAARSNKKVWWKCPEGPDHEWEIAPGDKKAQCPFCSGRRISITNSLATLNPDLAKEWHPTKNEDLTPSDVTLSSNKKVWWKCPEGPDHEWQAVINNRKNGTGCPCCTGKQLSVTNSLANVRPELANEWHPTKNGNLTPDQVLVGRKKSVWWKCPKGPDHEWEEKVGGRARCPFCVNNLLSVTNSLATMHPDLANRWHPTKNGDLTPDQIIAKRVKKVWWKCPEGPDHEWEGLPSSRCPFCNGLKVSVTNSISGVRPDLVYEWHPTKNGELMPDQVTAKALKKAWWKCPEGPDHEWEALISNRTRGSGCPFCAGYSVSITNRLSDNYPELAEQWHPTKNGKLRPEDVTFGTHVKVWWKCPEGLDHEWQTGVVNRLRTGCPRCDLRRTGWTIDNLRRYVGMLIEGNPPPLYSMTPAQLYAIHMQAEGLLEMGGQGKSFFKAFQTGLFPKEEIEAFVNREPSTVDEFISGDITSVYEIDEDTGEYEQISDNHLDDAPLDVVDGSNADDEDQQLPKINDIASILGALEHGVMASVDQEAVEFLMEASLSRLWSKVYSQFADVDSEIETVRNFQGDSYGQEVRNMFLQEYEATKSLEIPEGYNYRDKNTQEIVQPMLMQRHVAVKVRDKKRLGNWSGTGAGKTLSAILASRVIDASFTVVLCPNAVVDMWKDEILRAYPHSQVATKTWNPEWEFNSTKNRYLVLNYEMFQHSTRSEVYINNFLVDNRPDFIIVDEIHYAKTRSMDSSSQRRENVKNLVSLTQSLNPNLHVLGMSATPVINSLHEGKSLLEIITGQEFDDLKTDASPMNAQKMYQQFVRNGLRYMPDYSEMMLSEERPEIDISEHFQDVRDLGKYDFIGLEQILTTAKLPEILKNIKPKTLIYTMYIKGIDKILYDATTAAGWKVGFYTGQDKSGLEPFKKGNIDVLIGTSAIGTGVDGLQEVCNRLIINVLPWTAAEYEQLKGRIYRTGQKSKTVDVIMPATYMNLPNGDRWSWDDSKWDRVRWKKTLADTAVDGVVPEGKLRSPAEAYRDAINWLKRIDESGMVEVQRQLIDIPYMDGEDLEVAKRMATYGDFSKMNRHWNTTKSENTHERLKDNPEEWTHYHAMYREARKDWPVVPFEEMIKWLKPRKGRIVGDFGCGEAKLAEELAGICDVRSFDHVAINDDVTACDMADIPLDDEELDVAVFSLSLMGSNYKDYLKEGHRTLQLDGTLHIWEATSRFKSTDDFRRSLERLGFRQVEIEERSNFTHITATKDRTEIDYDSIEFNGL
ncbi:MAG: methyltransferase-like protein [Thermoplasmata archaeon]|nr:methyltransferase-like protein [Thermoplasmata archaeon]